MLEDRDVYCGKMEALKQGSVLPYKLLSRGEDTRNVSWELGKGKMIENVLGIKKSMCKSKETRKKPDMYRETYE